MKKYFLIIITLSLITTSFAQPNKKAKPKEKVPTQKEMDKMIEDAMKSEGMSKEEQVEMKKMMQGVMPGLVEQNNNTATYPEFSSNMQLVPKKDLRANAISKKILTQTEIVNYATGLYNKILAKGNSEEITIIKKISAKFTKGIDLTKAAILSLEQGHGEAALALSMKAVLAEPANPVWQNNMASMLTQYGFPDKAIPVLNKLNKEQPGNSTILNNMSYAWLGLGETDSMARFAGLAIAANPFHSDANTIHGLSEEIKGNHEEAADAYIESMIDEVEPFTEKLLENNNSQSKLEKLDFEKIKKSISIHTYFPADWFPLVPVLSSRVANYPKNKAQKDGYRLMNDSVLLQIDSIQKYLGKKLDVATSQDEQAFIKEMSNGMIDGQSKISKTAVLVLKVLHNYEMKWQQQFADEQKKLLTETNRYKSIYQNATKNLGAGNCGKYDEAADKYMQQVNTLIRDFYTKKANEFRQWLNAFTTWNMYVSGNPKNYVMMQDIESTGYLLGIYMSAINEQVAINTVCKTLDETIPSIIPLVEIPNFTCPSVVRVPSGNDWQELTAASTSFDENTLNIKRTNQPVPNHEVSYTTGKRIGQPGIDPSSKMSNGNVSTSYMTKEERADIADANHQRARSLLETLPKDAAESRHQSNLNMIAKLPHWSEIMAIRDLFNRIMKKSCNGPAKFTKPKFKLNPGDFTFEEIGPNEVSRKRTAHGTSVEYEDGSSQLIFDDGSILEMEGPDTYTVVNEKDILQQAGDAAKNHANNTHTPLKEFKDYYDKDGFSPTLNNSMQSPDLITVIKTLFD